ncbi:MAG TPA: Crp/Fnr family transcriptional regulator [Elusimicrobia bacterium]|nr:Crp/Fnr family transcriptional regulator [Elusimicrobiota bacterium]
MQKKGLKTILVQHHFLKDLPEPYLDLLEGCAANVRFAAGDYIIKEGCEANHFFLIRQGQVNVELPLAHRKPITVQTVSENEVLGWSWMIPPYRWHFSARAQGPVLAFSFDGRCLRTKYEKNHDLGFELYKRFSVIMSKRVEDTILQLAGLYS